MSEIGSIGGNNTPVQPLGLRRPVQVSVSDVLGRGNDSVEVSQTAQLLAKLSSLPDVRQGLIDNVRSQIAKGAYETPQKLDTALESALEDASE